MKFTELAEVNDFLKLVNSCKGEVWLESIYGDRFALKSVLSHYIAMSVLLVDRGKDLKLVCQLQEDEQLFSEYFKKYPAVNT